VRKRREELYKKIDAVRSHQVVDGFGEAVCVAVVAQCLWMKCALSCTVAVAGEGPSSSSSSLSSEHRFVDSCRIV
jgi:hypothetical protein